MFVEERHRAILQKLHRERNVRAAQLMEAFNLSFETIRRDLEHLEKQGLLQRVHGGAILPDPDYGVELPATIREMKYTEQKRQLAVTAAGFVQEGQSIAIDVSTTNTHFAQALKQRVQKLTVLTNSLPIVNELMSMPNYTVILIGGVVRSQELCVVGDLAEAFIAQFNVDTFFMSMSGVTLTDGVTDYGVGEVQIKKRLLECSRETFVLADSSKFDAVSLLKVCDAGQIRRFITDPLIHPEIVDRYRAHGIEIVYSDEKEGGV